MMKPTMAQPDLCQKRNLGIDALRIVAMLLIAIVHIYNRGGVASQLGGSTALAFQLNYPLRLLCYTAVDLDALISGYVMLEGRFRPARFLELWLQVVAIGLVECLIWSFFAPSGTVTFQTWLTALLPVTQYEYWYFTAYAGVFLLSPLLNRGLRSLNERQARALLYALFGLFCVGWLLGKLMDHDSFHLGGGYTTLWLLVLYLLGACVKQGGLFRSMPSWRLHLCALLCISTSWLLRNFLFLQALPEQVRDWGGLVLNYCSPLLVLFSLCELVLFSRLRLRGFAADAVRWLSPLTFGVYLIHVHPAVWSLLENLYVPLGKLPAWWILPAVAASGVGLLLCCSLLDWLRSLIFRLLRVRKLCDAAEARVVRLWRQQKRA